jgi:predicted acetylornithine/succinylornithine family transaminase
MTSLLGNYNRAPVTFVRGEGCHLYDDTGREYLDCIAGIAVCALGHAHPAIADAIATQAHTLVHTSNLYYHEPSGELAAELCRRSGFAAAFFCNSGTEANEAAIKLARKLAYRAGQPERTTILSCTGSFHGRTYGALAATSNESYKVGFGDMPAGFEMVPFNDVAALDDAIDDTVAAFIVEPVQGESGVNIASHAYLAEARRLCTERGALLIFDEIQCGMGRLGPLFAFEHFGVRPDVLTLAKALANGLPIGAMLVNEQAMSALQPGDHGTTFGGNAVCAAAALAHLRFRDSHGLKEQTLERGAQFMEKLAAVAARVPDVLAAPRGLGLLIALPVTAPIKAADIATSMREHGVLVGTGGGNTLRFAPPLIIDETQLDRACEALYAACGSNGKLGSAESVSGSTEAISR